MVDFIKLFEFGKVTDLSFLWQVIYDELGFETSGVG